MGMNVLTSLAQLQPSRTVAGEVSEFRLVCSGSLYNGAVMTAEWYKSDACRLLLHGPITLFVCSRPMDAYPQELMLQMTVPEVHDEGSGKDAPKRLTSFLPYEEVGDDFAALLTLLLRRLITVHSHARTVPAERILAGFESLRDWPLPIAQGRARAWRQRGASVAFGRGGVEGYTDYAPAPVGVEVRWLASILSALPYLPEASAIVMAARLYSRAMQLIEEAPDVSYHLLVAVAETLAGVALSDPPSEEQMLSSKPHVYRAAKKHGLDDTQAKDLTELACKGMNWSRNKFRRFLTEYGTEARWDKDDLFVDVGWAPKREGFKRALEEVYSARGAALHDGRPYPDTVGLGTASHIPARAAVQIRWGEFEGVPPVPWFERMLQNAAVSFISERCRRASAPTPEVQ